MKYLSPEDRPPEGTIIRDHSKSDRNPNRIGILIGYRLYLSHRCMICISGEGTIYHPIRDKDSKLEIIGKADLKTIILNAEYTAQMIKTFHS